MIRKLHSINNLLTVLIFEPQFTFRLPQPVFIALVVSYSQEYYLELFVIELYQINQTSSTCEKLNYPSMAHESGTDLNVIHFQVKN